MQNDWTMNKKQNIMSHTRITHDKFHNKKIPNGCQSAIFFFSFFFYYFFLITRATNKEIFVGAFQEKASSRSYLANIHSNVSQ